MKLILTYIISCTISKLSQIIVQILDENGHFAFLSPFGTSGNVRCSSYAHWKAPRGLPIRVNWTFLAKCYRGGATCEYRLEINVLKSGGSVSAKISGRRGTSTTNRFARIDRPVNSVQLCCREYSHKDSPYQIFFKWSALFCRKRPFFAFLSPLWELRGNIRCSSWANMQSA